MSVSEKLWIDGTKVYDTAATVASPAGFGTIRTLAFGFGTPDQETLLEPRPLADGLLFRGSVAGQRTFKLRFAVSGVASRGEGYAEWAAFLDLFSTEKGLITLKTERDDGAASPVTRELDIIAMGEPSWSLVRGEGEAGVRYNGNLVIELDVVAPFPWWRSATAETETINFSGTGSGNVAIARLGQMACGVEAKITTNGTLGSITLDDASRSMTMTATFGASAKGVDWYFADPTATVIDSGVTISIPSHLSLHSASTTITASTADGGASGNHTVTLRYYPLWKSP